MFRQSAFGFLILALARVAAAQPSAQPLTATWQDGFVVESADGAFRVQLGAIVQTDGRFSVDEPSPITNTFLLRKARPIVAGRIARHFDFRLMTDFGNGQAIVLDAYVDTRFSSAFRLRVGKDKTPIGYELLIGDTTLWFPERMLQSGLVPNRDVGFAAHGDLFGQKLTYAGGVYNGVPDGVTSSADVDTNGGKDAAGRVVVRPFGNGPGFHLGGSAGSQRGALPSLRTSIGQPYFAYEAGTTANGSRRRVTPAVFYVHRSFGAFAEYVRSTQDVLRSGVTREVSHDGYGVSASFLVTGEAASVGIIRPRRPFDPASGQWGALQLLARYSTLRVDADAFRFALAAPGASRRAESFTVGVNWFPVTFVKWYATYERTVFDGEPDGPRPAENAILFRAQFAF